MRATVSRVPDPGVAVAARRHDSRAVGLRPRPRAPRLCVPECRPGARRCEASRRLPSRSRASRGRRVATGVERARASGGRLGDPDSTVPSSLAVASTVLRESNDCGGDHGVGVAGERAARGSPVELPRPDAVPSRLAVRTSLRCRRSAHGEPGRRAGRHDPTDGVPSRTFQTRAVPSLLAVDRARRGSALKPTCDARTVDCPSRREGVATAPRNATSRGCRIASGARGRARALPSGAQSRRSPAAERDARTSTAAVELVARCPPPPDRADRRGLAATTNASAAARRRR